jgi:hypothetical protein
LWRRAWLRDFDASAEQNSFIAISILQRWLGRRPYQFSSSTVVASK